MDKKIIQEWILAKSSLDTWKEKELELRQIICAEVLEGKQKGTSHLLEHGWDIVATAKLNTTVDSAVLDQIWPELSLMEKEAIRYKPEVIAKQYNLITDSGSKLHLAITTKPGTPSLELKPQKEN